MGNERPCTIPSRSTNAMSRVPPSPSSYLVFTLPPPSTFRSTTMASLSQRTVVSTVPPPCTGSSSFFPSMWRVFTLPESSTTVNVEACASMRIRLGTRFESTMVSRMRALALSLSDTRPPPARRSGASAAGAPLPPFRSRVHPSWAELAPGCPLERWPNRGRPWPCRVAILRQDGLGPPERGRRQEQKGQNLREISWYENRAL